MTQPAAHLSGVSRRFRRTRALDDLTLDIPENAITGLLGRNGAGKTTLSRSSPVTTVPRRARSASSAPTRSRTPRRCPPSASSATISDTPTTSHCDRCSKSPRSFTPNGMPRSPTTWSAASAPHKTAIKKLSRGQSSSLGIVLGLASRAPLTIFDEPYLGLDATAAGSSTTHSCRTTSITPNDRGVHASDRRDGTPPRARRHRRRRTTRPLRRGGRPAGKRGHPERADPAVEDLARGVRVLQRRTIGGLTSVVLETHADEDLRARVARAGAQLTPATLQDLVAAYGVESESLEGTPA